VTWEEAMAVALHLAAVRRKRYQVRGSRQATWVNLNTVRYSYVYWVREA
jgi:hypothetical protein